MRRFLRSVAERVSFRDPVAGAWEEFGPVATTSGTAVDLKTDFPADTEEIELGIEGIQTNAANQVGLIQIGAGSYLTAGYIGNLTLVSGASQTVNVRANGLGLSDTAFWDASIPLSGFVRLKRMQANRWHGFYLGGRDAGVYTWHSFTWIDVAGALERVRVTTSGGTAVFNGGQIVGSFRRSRGASSLPKV